MVDRAQSTNWLTVVVLLLSFDCFSDLSSSDLTQRRKAKQVIIIIIKCYFDLLGFTCLFLFSSVSLLLVESCLSICVHLCFLSTIMTFFVNSTNVATADIWQSMYLYRREIKKKKKINRGINRQSLSRPVCDICWSVAVISLWWSRPNYTTGGYWYWGL